MTWLKEILNFFSSGSNSAARKKKTARTRKKTPGARNTAHKNAVRNRANAPVTPINQRNDEPIINDIDEILYLAKSAHPSIEETIRKIQGKPPLFVSQDLNLYAVANSQANDAETQLIQKVMNILYRIHPDNNPVHYQVDRIVFNSFIDMRKSQTVQSRAKESSEVVEAMLQSAIKNKATDIHVEVRGEHTFLYERVNRGLKLRNRFGAEQGIKINHAIWNLYAKLPFADSDVSKDGRFTYIHQDRSWLIRVSYVYSEANRQRSIAMRLRDMHHIVPLEQLGYHDNQLKLIKRSIRNKGMTLMIGSVNSGKSTTQTAIMQERPKNDKNYELSDQIEVELDHFVQLQLPTKGTKEVIEENKERLMRASTRQDVNFIAINEIRDKQTGTMASTMLSQGTAAIASVHGSSWVDAINRLLAENDLNIPESNLFSESFLSLLITQTLLSVLCDKCKLPRHPDEEINEYYREILSRENAAKLRFLNEDGCPACQHTGRVGMTLAAETIPVSEPNRPLLRATTEPQKMRAWMRENNILSIHQHGLEKALEGKVDPEQVQKHLGPFSKYNIFDQFTDQTDMPGKPDEPLMKLL